MRFLLALVPIGALAAPNPLPGGDHGEVVTHWVPGPTEVVEVRTTITTCPEEELSTGVATATGTDLDLKFKFKLWLQLQLQLKSKLDPKLKHIHFSNCHPNTPSTNPDHCRQLNIIHCPNFYFSSSLRELQPGRWPEQV
ncbi:hypothetical protein BJX96DRAFT_180885 [Aspergillus floccosus]